MTTSIEEDLRKVTSVTEVAPAAAAAWEAANVYRG